MLFHQNLYEPLVCTVFMASLEALVDSIDGFPIDPRFFRRDPRFSLRVSDYSVRGYRKGGSQDLPDVNFSPEQTGYAVILQAPRKGKKLDIALAGFNSSEGIIDCLQLQGGANRYRELIQLSHWEQILLRQLEELGRKSGLSEVRVIPSWMLPYEESERLFKRYDASAKSCGFKYSDTEQRYILPLH
jgi:hypothetical protein